MAEGKIFSVADMFQDSNYKIKKQGLLSKNVKKEFPWENACNYLSKNFHVVPGDLEVLRQILVFGNEAQKGAFERLVNHMGPIVSENYENSKQQYWTFGQIAQLQKQEWFHAFLSSDGCTFKLSNLPSSSWLVRFSTRVNGAFAISMLTNETEINHWVLSPTKNPQNGKEVSVHETKDGKSFKDLYELVEYYKKNNLPDCNSCLKNIAFSLEGKLTIGKKLGGGNFGEVFLAVWHRQSGDMRVAAKSLQEVKDDKAKDNQKEYDQETQLGKLQDVQIVAFSKEFEAEANLLKNLDHVNVVRFFGICVVNEVQYIVTELMDRGSVISFLSSKTKDDITPLQVVKMSNDAALGMAYLSARGVIHRDLAARNLLISEVVEGKEWIVKVTDFGLSRKVEKGKYYQKSGKTGDPIKWAAPETFKPQPGKEVFKGRVSERSDRWSYGIVLYELFDLCRNQPYPELNNASVRGLLGEKDDMSKYLPLDDAPAGIKELIKDCLNYDSQARPDFPTIAARLVKIEEDIKKG